MKSLLPVNFGMWAWGIVTALLGAFIVVVILTGHPHLIFARIKGSETAIGAVVAASALAWSHFFQIGTRSEENSKLGKISEAIADISRRMDSPAFLKDPVRAQHERDLD